MECENEEAATYECESLTSGAYTPFSIFSFSSRGKPGISFTNGKSKRK